MTITRDKIVTLQEVIKHLQKECIPSPINYRKVVRAFSHDVCMMHQALAFLHQGQLDNYHMLSGKGDYRY